MKKIFIIITILVLSLAIISLGVIYFMGKDKVTDNTNEQEEKQVNEVVENIIANETEGRTQETENKEIKEDITSQSDNKQQTTTTTKVEESNKKTTPETEKTQKQETTKTTTTQTKRNNNKSNSNKKEIDVELDKSTTYNIDGAGTASKGYLTEEQMKALGL